MGRKSSANKQGRIQTRRRSLTWDHFKKMPKEEGSKPTIVCIYCGCKEYGTTNMLSHFPRCSMYPYASNNDPKQQILNFERKYGGKQLLDSMSHAFDLKECRKGINVFVISDE